MTDFASAPQIKLISKHDGVLLIEVSGSLTALDHRLIDTIAGYLEAGHRNFVLRMSGVTNIDSAGLGQLIYQGIVFRDFPVVQAVVLLTAGIVISVNLLVDIIYAYLDPRIRYE